MRGRIQHPLINLQRMAISIESFPNRSKLIAMTNKLAGNEMLVRDGFKGWERRG